MLFFTQGVPPPADLTTEQVQPSSVTLRWNKAGGMDTIPHHFLITYSSPGSESRTTQTADCCTTLTDLQPGTQYTVGVSTLMDHGGRHSKPASKTITTGKTPEVWMYSRNWSKQHPPQTHATKGGNRCLKQKKNWALSFCTNWSCWIEEVKRCQGCWIND